MRNLLLKIAGRLLEWAVKGHKWRIKHYDSTTHLIVYKKK
jgi:hypothetical protein